MKQDFVGTYCQIMNFTNDWMKACSYIIDLDFKHMDSFKAILWNID